MEHSLAPWRAEKTYSVDREDDEMCIMAYFPEFEKECRIADVFDPNDARLIAAAPELLEACALAVAEAEMYLGSEDFSASDAEVMFRNILNTARAAIRKATESITKEQGK
jgi:hypothetical protein